MNLDLQIEKIEAAASHFIKTKDKNSFLDIHGKIALAIYDELPRDLKTKFNYEANKTLELLNPNKNASETASPSEENIRFTTDFFSKMMIIYTNMQNKTKRERKSILDLFKGVFTFAVSLYILWTIFFTITFGFQQTSIISIVISVVLALLLIRFDKIVEGGI